MLQMRKLQYSMQEETLAPHQQTARMHWSVLMTDYEATHDWLWSNTCYTCLSRQVWSGAAWILKVWILIYDNKRDTFSGTDLASLLSCRCQRHQLVHAVSGFAWPKGFRTAKGLWPFGATCQQNSISNHKKAWKRHLLPLITASSA